MSRIRAKRQTLLVGCIAMLVAFQFSVASFAETQVYRSVKNDRKQIAISFDDGPHPYLTEKILDILDRYQVKATFFTVGVNVQNYPDVAKKVLSKGHEIGNHTFSHHHLDSMCANDVYREISLCEEALEELCEYRPKLFRPPEGAINRYIQACSETEDYQLILWSVDTRDWEVKDAKKIANTVLEQVQSGDIILMHDYIGRGSQTPEALEMLLPELLARGYELVTVSRLIGVF